MYRILSIDGGGIRGIIPAKWLTKLEEELGSPLHTHFDLVVGTSTGAMLAAGISAGIPAADLLNIYVESGCKIFPPRGGFNRSRRNFVSDFFTPIHRPEPLRETLKANFSLPGRLMIFGELKIDCMIVTYDVLSRRPRVFCSWSESDQGLEVWSLCTASCSAPTYFPAHVINLDGVDFPLIDGGVVANNPSGLALAYAIKRRQKLGLIDFETAEEIFLVSMGTGNLTRPISVEEACKWGTAQWAMPILDVIFDGTSSADELVCEAILKDDNYVRLQFELMIANDDMDDASRENIQDLQAEAMRYLSDQGGRRSFERIVEGLKKNSKC